MVALRDYLKTNQDTEVTPKSIEKKFLKNDEDICQGNDRYKLLLTDTDRDILNQLVDGKKLENVKSNILSNYDFFLKKIETGKLTPKEIDEAIGKLQIVEIMLDRVQDDAQAIFESLNSTGKVLTMADLIRNFVLMKLTADKQQRVYEYYWQPMEKLFFDDGLFKEEEMNNFFRDYLTMKKTSIPNQNRVYEEFKTYYNENVTSDEGVEEFSKDLVKFAKIYTDIVFVRADDEKLKNLYKDIKELKMAVSYPFLMKLHNDFADKKVTEQEFLDIIRLCANYVLRRSICGLSAASLNRTFAALLVEVKDEDYLDSFKAFLISKNFPNDIEFVENFKIKNIYDMRNRLFVLRHLEHHNNKQKIDVSGYTIEHIMPQNENLSESWQNELGENWKEIQEKYLHTIGNLTFTKYNSEMSDRPFKQKLEMMGGFKQSGLRLNMYVIKDEKWNEERIKERAQLLAKDAKEIWDYPKITDEKLAFYKKSKGNNDRDIANFEDYKWNDVNKALFDELEKHILNLSPEVRRELKKKYIAYKLDSNFADVLVQKSQLCIFVNMKFSDLSDPDNICTDNTEKAHYGNGDVKCIFNNNSDINKVMHIIKQSYDFQANE